jgi:hypothetical protein
MKSETTGEGKLNTIDKLQSNKKDEVLEDKRSLTYYLLQPPRLLITPITHCHMTRNTNKLNGLRMIEIILS